jgi:hypothetical protein
LMAFLGFFCPARVVEGATSSTAHSSNASGRRALGVT